MTKLPDSNPKANVRQSGNGAQASIVGSTGLKGAMDELHSQHPQKYDDLGPHHGGSDHMRHEKLGGLKPSGR